MQTFKNVDGHKEMLYTYVQYLSIDTVFFLNHFASLHHRNGFEIE